MAFEKGNLGGPGRPVGSRNKLSTEFLDTLYEDFKAHGKATIEAARESDPVAYCRLVVSLLPRDVRITERRLVEMTDAEILAQLNGVLRAEKLTSDGPGDGPGDEPKSVH